MATSDDAAMSAAVKAASDEVLQAAAAVTKACNALDPADGAKWAKRLDRVLERRALLGDPRELIRVARHLGVAHLRRQLVERALHRLELVGDERVEHGHGLLRPPERRRRGAARRRRDDPRRGAVQAGDHADESS